MFHPDDATLKRSELFSHWTVGTNTIVKVEMFSLFIYFQHSQLKSGPSAEKLYYLGKSLRMPLVSASANLSDWYPDFQINRKYLGFLSNYFLMIARITLTKLSCHQGVTCLIYCLIYLCYIIFNYFEKLFLELLKFKHHKSTFW